MTGAEWDSCTDPQAMLEWLRHSGQATDRKLRLVACACARRAWDLLDEPSRTAVPGVEQDADEPGKLRAWAVSEWEERLAGQSPSRPLQADSPLWWRVVVPLLTGRPADVKQLAAWLIGALHAKANDTRAASRAVPGDEVRAARAAWAAAQAAKAQELSLQCNFLRDVLGNPFRPPPPLDPSVLSWGDRLVVRMASAAYEERPHASGHLDTARLAILADALEEAGCTDAELLGHLRSPGPHVRGCDAVDALLGNK